MVQKHAGMRKLKVRDLVQHFGDGSWSVGDLRVQPLELPHDDPARTYGFIVLAPCHGRDFKAGFVNDLGHASEDLIDQLVDCDLLAIEHNHDAELLWTSSRPYALKKRIRGPNGHLSNDQGSQLLGNILERSMKRHPSHVFLTHMSQECNTEELAIASARSTLDKAACSAKLHVAGQDKPTEMVWMPSDTETGDDKQLSLWEDPEE
jgi:phosphoribosyl 1,2-cyclic phosphodiesterase